jgi:hypothetical protein
VVACPALLAPPAAPAALALAALYVFAAFLYSNNVAREQVLLDAGYDYFQHENAGKTLAAAAHKFMFPAVTDSDHD